jgi:hypothetical protein
MNCTRNDMQRLQLHRRFRWKDAFLALGLLACNTATDPNLDSEAGVRSSRQNAVSGTNIPECDAYLSAYENRINGVVLSATDRASALAGLHKNRDDWFAMADSPAKKEALARMCAQASLDLAKNTLTWANSGGGSGGSGGGGGGGSGGAGGGGGVCNSSSATLISAQGTDVTLAANACFKINPDTSNPVGRKIKLQRQPGTTATLPLNFTYRQNSGASCASAGALQSGSFSSPNPDALTPPSSTFNTACPVVYSLQGSASSQLKFRYWYQ